MLTDLQSKKLHQVAHSCCIWLSLIVCGCSGERQPADAAKPPSAQAKLSQTAPPNITQSLAEIKKLIELDQHALAEVKLRELLVKRPDHPEAIFQLALVQSEKGSLEDAIQAFDSIPDHEKELVIPARGKAAELCEKLERYDEAISRYLAIYKLEPAVIQTHRQLANLLNRQGRRHEAAKHLRVLCKLGDIRQDELHALMVLSDAIYDDPQAPPPSNSVVPLYYPISNSGKARYLFSTEQYLAAADLLENSIRAVDCPRSMLALYGRCLAEAQEDSRFLAWLEGANKELSAEPEYWAGLGAWLLNQQDFNEAVRALGEAIKLDGTDARSMRRLQQALVALGDQKNAKIWDDRHQLLREVTLASNEIGKASRPDPMLLQKVIDGLGSLDRPLESLLWQFVANYYCPGSQPSSDRLVAKRLEIVSSGNSFASEEERLCHFDLSRFPLPDTSRLLTPSNIETATAQKQIKPSTEFTPPQFANVAEEVGIQHVYQVSNEPQNEGFTIYQVMGGGVAVIDYDLDGQCDLYFAQGGAEPPEFISQQSDILYRHLKADSKLPTSKLKLDRTLLNVTKAANVEEYQYSTGVTTGDWNQDGFQDIVVGNLGLNTLFINCGDGTFKKQSFGDRDAPQKATSSLGMADLNGDGLPDLVECNYVDDADYLRKPSVNSKGELEIVSPFDYQPAMDRLFINDGRGTLTPSELGTHSDDRSTGLGVILGPLQQNVSQAKESPSSIQIYVGNDVRPNQLWRIDSTGSWSDIAPLMGCALGHDGSRTSSMGIAAADFDRSGTIDLHITNFEKAPARMYMNRGNGFQDRAISLNLAQDSFEVLGFGTQAIDYNNDGWPDIAVTNGHVENTHIPGSPFEQPPQLFVNTGDSFKLTSVVDSSGYFGGTLVGRALARVDFDDDGRQDMVVTHLGTRSALVMNQTANTGNWVKVKLVGTTSEREPIGSRVEIKSKDESWVNWLMGGDGYLCRNESVIHFGLGSAATIDALTIDWPSGHQTSIRDLKVNFTYQLVENETAATVLDSSEAL